MASFHADMVEEIDGKHVAYSADDPDQKYAVTLLDGNGNETDDMDRAVGGIVEFAPDCFKTFFWAPLH